MKKRILIIIFACFISITSCSSNTTDQKESITSTEETIEEADSISYNGELTIEFSFGSRTGTYSGEVNADGLPHGKGSFHTVISDNESWTYDGDWENGHMNGTGRTSWDSGQTYIGSYENDKQSGSGTLTRATGESYQGNFYNSLLVGDAVLTYPDGSSFHGNFSGADLNNASGTYYDADGNSCAGEIVNGKLSLTFPDNDFLSDSERSDTYKNLFESYKYNELSNYIDEYISNNATTPFDSAYIISDYVNQVEKYEEQWNVSANSFDNAYTISFPNANSISTDNSFCVELSNTDLSIKAGFRMNNWLFFDSISLSVDGNNVYSCSVNSSNITRSTISGKTVEEYCFIDFNDDVFDKLPSANNVIIRFSNKKSGTDYDHELTRSEIDSLVCGHLLQINNRELSNILYRYQNQ